jgi:hypothetical protein
MTNRAGRRRLLLAGAGLFAVMIAAHLLLQKLRRMLILPPRTSGALSHPDARISLDVRLDTPES